MLLQLLLPPLGDGSHRILKQAPWLRPRAAHGEARQRVALTGAVGSLALRPNRVETCARLLGTHSRDFSTLGWMNSCVVGAVVW